MRIVIVGGGAAGLMCAATIAENNPNAEVVVIEKNTVLGRKVAISGGGRCNVTTGRTDIKEILANYPRGKNFLKFAMHEFSPKEVMKWFETHGVALKTEKDLRVFPKSDRGVDVVEAFERVFDKFGVKVLLKKTVEKIEKSGQGFVIHLNDGAEIQADKVVLTTGGQSYRMTGSSGEGYMFASNLGHAITELAPSLNAFLLAEKWPKKLSGVSFQKARLRFIGEKTYDFIGPFIFTHKGISGPAIFALSSLVAFEKYNAKSPKKLAIDFLPELAYEELSKKIAKEMQENTKKLFVKTLSPFATKSLIMEVFNKIGINGNKVNNEISKNEFNKAIESLKNLTLTVVGGSPGEEFVTAGGVDFKEVDSKTMQSKICSGLYFAGEILNVDGFTGGFNLQSAWATGRIAGLSCS